MSSSVIGNVANISYFQATDCGKIRPCKNKNNAENSVTWKADHQFLHAKNPSSYDAIKLLNVVYSLLHIFHSENKVNFKFELL